MFSVFKVLGREASLDVHDGPGCELSAASATRPADPVSAGVFPTSPSLSLPGAVLVSAPSNPRGLLSGLASSKVPSNKSLHCLLSTFW